MRDDDAEWELKPRMGPFPERGDRGGQRISLGGCPRVVAESLAEVGRGEED